MSSKQVSNPNGILINGERAGAYNMLEFTKEEAIEHFSKRYEILKLKINTGSELDKQEVELINMLLDEQLNKVVGSVSNLGYGVIVKIDEETA